MFKITLYITNLILYYSWTYFINFRSSVNPFELGLEQPSASKKKTSKPAASKTSKLQSKSSAKKTIRSPSPPPLLTASNLFENSDSDHEISTPSASLPTAAKKKRGRVFPDSDVSIVDIKMFILPTATP